MPREDVCFENDATTNENQRILVLCNLAPSIIIRTPRTNARAHLSKPAGAGLGHLERPNRSINVAELEWSRPTVSVRQ